jgi:hypothetical protein
MQGSIFERSRGQTGGFIIALLSLLGMAASTQAQTFTLSSANSSVSINAGGGPGLAGMSSYLVDGVNQVKQQWFYYRIGDVGANQSIDSMGNLVAAQGDLSTLSLTYSDLPSSPNYQANVAYTLTGGAAGSGQSSLGETVTFYNTSASSLVLRFFDYSDFDIASLLGGQSVTLAQTGLGPPSNKAYTTRFTQTSGSLSVISTTASGPNANTQMEANLFSATLQTLTNGSPSSLNGVLTANGDVTAAAEWDITLAAGKSLQLSKTIQLSVPEPSCAAVMLVGLTAWAMARRARSPGVSRPQ